MAPRCAKAMEQRSKTSRRLPSKAIPTPNYCCSIWDNQPAPAVLVSSQVYHNSPCAGAPAYLEPAGFRDRPVTPGARLDGVLGEYILPYEALRNAADPEALLLDFL